MDIQQAAKEIGMQRGEGLPKQTEYKIGDKVECVLEDFHSHKVVFGDSCHVPKVGDKLTIRKAFSRRKGVALRFEEIVNSNVHIDCYPSYEDGSFEPAFREGNFKKID